MKTFARTASRLALAVGLAAALPAAAQIQALPPEARAALRALLKDLQVDCRARAEECWRKHKAPMAAYWKATAVYANHTSRLCA